MMRPTYPFTILEPQNQEIGEFDVVKKRRVFKLLNWERIGRVVIFLPSILCVPDMCLRVSFFLLEFQVTCQVKQWRDIDPKKEKKEEVSPGGTFHNIRALIFVFSVIRKLFSCL